MIRGVVGTCLAAASPGRADADGRARDPRSQGNTTFYLGIGSWIAHHVPYERRGRVTGLIEVSWAFGLLLGVSTMGLVTAATNWRVGLPQRCRRGGRDGRRRDRLESIHRRRDEHRIAARRQGPWSAVSRGWLILLVGLLRSLRQVTR